MRATLPVIAFMVAACNGADPAAAPALVRFDGTEYAFSGPVRVGAGMVRFRFVNAGAAIHHAVVARIDSGRTTADLVAYYDTATAQAPSWARYVGGASAVMPGDSADVLARLTPGHYAVLCFLPSDSGTHLERGMAAAFEVEGNPVTGATPSVTGAIALVDYGFQLSPPPIAGSSTYRVTNPSGQVHEVQLFQLAAGRTADDYGAWAAAGFAGPPPGRLAGGIGALSPGEEAFWELTLAPGDYLLLCQVPDAGDGRPHTAHGMVLSLTVR